MTSVLIVEDQRMAREDMENSIQSSGRYTLTASIANAAMAETVCRRSGCELVLMDICTENDESGLIAAEKIKKNMPQTKVILVTSMAECSFIERARKAGADSFWYKDAGKKELLEVMDRTMQGERIYPDAPPVVMIGTARSCEFTSGEIEVLRLVVEGQSYKKIAEMLSISPETVKWHIKNMLQKTNFDSKTKLAVAVTKKNLIINGV
ncbi:MAG: response regulator transcription factor [Candidatus Limivivens sp.]|nr:response regulator transcription factor [Candidatus Limivivens sp.]